MPLVICQGNDSHLEDLILLSKRGNFDYWTIVSTAAPGDEAIVYLTAPRSSFVATARVAGWPSRELGRKYGWPGHFMARVERVRLFARPVTLEEARRAIPDWGWLRQPRKSCVVPVVHALVLKRLAGRMKAPPAMSTSAIEGVRAETMRLSRSRSRPLRDFALAQAKGRCECCGNDFSVLGKIGYRVLQVHHRVQLSARSRPLRTRFADLAVVCANCHLMAHTDSKMAATVSSVRRRLLNASTTKRRWAE